MRNSPLSDAGWRLVVLLVLLSPLVQGGAPRLPTALVQIGILALAALWAYEWGWQAPCRSLRLSLVDLHLWFLLFAALFSFLFAPYQYSALRALQSLLCYAALYWWIISHPSLGWLETVLTALIAQGLLQGGAVWFQWLRLDTIRPAGTFLNPNFMASLVAAAAVLALGRAVYPPPGGVRRGPQVLLWAAAALFMAGAVVLSGSRGGVLALGAGAAVLLAGRSLKITLGAVGAGAAALLLVPNPWSQRLLDVGTHDVYAFSRISIWKSAVRMMIDHPLLGIGLGQYEYFSPRYAFPVEAHWAKYGRVASAAHSEYLHAGAELGFTGLAVTLSALAMIALFAWGRIRRTPLEGRRAVVPLAASLCVLSVHSAVDFPLHAPPLSLLLVLLAAGLRLQGAEGPSRPVEFRMRKSYAVCLLAAFALLALLALRTPVAFWHFLGGTGSPQNLLREKWALEEAPKRALAPAEAIPFLERAVWLEPQNAAYHYALGSRFFQTYLSEGGSEEMRQRGLFHASYAAQLNPNNFRYPFGLGQALENLHRRLGKRTLLLGAYDEYLKALSLSPRNYSLREKAGMIAEELGRTEEAEEHLREAVSLEPSYLRGWYNLSVFLARRGKAAEARETALRGRNEAELARRPERRPATPYEKALVDFDPQLFDNFIEVLDKDKDSAFR